MENIQDQQFKDTPTYPREPSVDPSFQESRVSKRIALNQYEQFCAASPILENLMMRLRNLTGATVLALGLKQ